MIRLMKRTFYDEEQVKDKLINFIRESDRLSMGPKCKEFEEEFSGYQGRKYSVLFNSGSSANLALIQALMNMGLLNKGDKVGFSALTWATNVMPLIQLGLEPIPIDVSLENLNVTLDNIKELDIDLKAIFITNLLGFCGNLDKIKEYCDEKGILLLEDNCESLGSQYKLDLLGNFGFASTFSFFVGHHISTIEGGMVCTDSEELYNHLLMVRSHGWGRDISDEMKKKYAEEYNIDDFYGKYTFYNLGYNLRPTEITGFIGLEQIKSVGIICQKRKLNFEMYMRAAGKNNKIQKLSLGEMNFVSNFAFPLIFKDKKSFKEYKEIFEDVAEIRPIVGGSMVKQPFFKNKEYKCPNAEKIHNLGFYIPNNPDLTDEEVNEICNLMK